MPKPGGGLAGTVTTARKEELAQKYREAIAEDTAVLTTHLLATEVIRYSLVQEATDAEAEAHYALSRHKKRADQFALVVELNDDTRDIDLGDTVTLRHTRYGLAALEGDADERGHPAVVIGVEPDARGNHVTLTVLMTAGSFANLIMPNGDYLVMPNGDYLTTPPS